MTSKPKLINLKFASAESSDSSIITLLIRIKANNVCTLSSKSEQYLYIDSVIHVHV